MTKRMLIDATHAEETRVVVLDGNRLEDFDVETAAKKQLKGNIYLAKVVRVEPSLQAAFVEYGGGRHGFLAFSEIHPDYYQIPVADRQRLLELQEAEARAEEEADDAAAAADEAAERSAGSGQAQPVDDGPSDAAPVQEMAPLGVHSEAAIPGHRGPEDHGDLTPAGDDWRQAGWAGDDGQDAAAAPEPLPQSAGETSLAHAATGEAAPPPDADVAAPLGVHNGGAIPGHAEAEHVLSEPVDPPYGDQAEIAAVIEAAPPAAAASAPGHAEPPPRTQASVIAQDIIVASEYASTETLGADLVPEAMEPATSDAEFAPHADPVSARDTHDHDQSDDDQRGEEGRGDDDQRDEDRRDEPQEARVPARFMRSYKIQEVIRRRQILLIQVVKEERGSKGAALTTYISLAGRFSVLMPNSPRGGGISRKITSTADRRRLKEITSELHIPRGMGLIVRTAGANRPKAEIKRDCEYLLELWDSIRDTTMKSIAPALIHEEANLIKRAIRDNYSRDVDEVLVDGEAGWRAARDFMRMLMPAHARKVVLWQDPQPLFARQQVEAQLDAMLVPTVQLKSGGYLVINQTEALVAIDVNSGRSTRERGIEETALKTNLEAADEVARQLRLRDLAGLIVVDFIDMESRRNNAAVEKRMKDALKDDRARIQLGTISSFGLLEMSRQRLRPSLAETSFTPCPHCGGTGHVRSTETSALAVLRAIEEEGAKRRAAEICVYVAGAIALYVLNHKRVRLAEIEARYGMTVTFAADESLLPPQTRIEKLRAQAPGEMQEPVAPPLPVRTQPIDAEDDLAVEEADEAEEAPEAVVAPGPAAMVETASEAETRKRRRRRRGGRREDGVAEPAPPAAALTGPPDAAAAAIDPALADQPDLPIPPPAVGDGEEPGLATAAAEEARGRRRGRRGGRRRRRDEPGGETAPLAGTAPGFTDEGEEPEEPASFDAPARAPYSGPTPADPFGGGVFDIYDVMEQAEARAAAIPPPRPAAPARPEVEAAAAEATVPSYAAPELRPPAAAPDDAEPVVGASSETPATAAAPASVVEQAIPLQHAAEETLPEPEPSPDPVAAEKAQPVPLEHAAQETLPELEPAPEPRPEPVAGPISVPMIIGGEQIVAEKKRGWWRR